MAIAQRVDFYNIVNMAEIKVLIVEDEPAIAKYIENTLKDSKYKVSAIAFDYEAALEELENNPPDVILLDINLQGSKDGIDLANFIRDTFRLPFLFITSYSNSMTLERAKQTHPIGYIIKPFSEQDLLSTLEISLFRFENKSKDVTLSFDGINSKLFSPLSKREFEILEGVYNGLTNQELAESNFLSVNTIKTHIRSLYGKMDVSSRWELLIKLREMV